MTTKILISGGPHTGKTTLFEAVRSTFGEQATYVEEPATTVIKSIGNAVINDPEEFCRRCIDVSLEQEDLASKKAQIMIQDRSLVDTVAYARRDGCENLIPGLMGLIAAANYSSVFFCDPVGDYATTEARHEDQETAMKTHGMLQEAYEDTGMPMIKIPPVSVGARVELVLRHVGRVREQYLMRSLEK